MICLFKEDEAWLLLRDVRRDLEGNIKFAQVVNGGWNLEIRNNEVLAKSGNYIVSREPLSEYYEMEIPKNVVGDYQDVMDYAKEEYSRNLNK